MKKGMELPAAVDAVVAAIKDPVIKAPILRTNRTLLDYRPVDNPKGKRLRLFISGGVVMNPKVEEEIRANMDAFHAVRLRRTREPIRHLILEE